jgi:hypothetical protein
MACMNAILGPGAPRHAMADHVRRAAAAILALTSFAVGSQVAAQEQTATQGQTAAQQYTPAVLKLHEFDFFYQSSVVNLSCIALKGRISSILRVLGARDDVHVDVTGCDVLVADEPADVWHSRSDRTQNPSDRWRTSSSSRLARRSATRAQSSHIRLRMMMPVEVTPEVLAELEKDKSRRELVSRVLKNPALGLNEPIVFPAQRQLVTLSRRTVDLEAEECELLEQMSTTVFPRLGIRVVRRGPNCGRDGVSRMPPQVTVEALLPVIPAGPQLLPPEEPPAESAPAPTESVPSAPPPSEPAADETKSAEPAPAPKPE